MSKYCQLLNLILVQLFILGSIPFLLATFGMLHLFYRVFHPWVSEGISVGFEAGRKRRDEMMKSIYDPENDENVELTTASDAYHCRCCSGQKKGTYFGIQNTLLIFFLL